MPRRSGGKEKERDDSIIENSSSDIPSSTSTPDSLSCDMTVLAYAAREKHTRGGP